MCVTGVVCDLVTGEVYEEYERAMQQLLAMADAMENSFAALVRTLEEQFDLLADYAIQLPACGSEQQTEAVGISRETPAHIPFCACQMRWHTATTGT